MPGIAHLQQENITLRRERDTALERAEKAERARLTLLDLQVVGQSKIDTLEQERDNALTRLAALSQGHNRTVENASTVLDGLARAEARIRALEAENATLGIKLSNLHDENAALKLLVLEYSQSDDYITDSPGQCTCGLCQRARQLLGEDVQG